LKNQLQDSAFAKSFVSNDGIAVIAKCIIEEEVGNSLAYGLFSLDTSMTYGVGWDAFTIPVVEKILLLFDSQNLNVRLGALKIGVHLASSKNFGYPAIIEVLKKLEVGEYKLIKILLVILQQDADVESKILCVTFINAIIKSAPLSQREDWIKRLEDSQLTQVLKAQLGSADNDWKMHVIKYLEIKFELDTTPTPYDKNNSEHEAMLLQLWETVFPNEKLENRISKQWNKMGFQGTDPATDFRGMGLLALKHLLYFAKNYTDICRDIMTIQATNDSTYYPVSTAGINITKMLFDIFKNLSEKKKEKDLDLLFGHPRALEEIYCIALRFFDVYWKENGGTYMQFSQIISTVNERISKLLTECTSLNQFQVKSMQKARDKNKKSSVDSSKGGVKKVSVVTVAEKPDEKKKKTICLQQ